MVSLVLALGDKEFDVAADGQHHYAVQLAFILFGVSEARQPFRPPHQ